VLTLPLWTGMTDQQVDDVGHALARLAARPVT
jgi:dTDP-4-amino-4,6-dideoxygalactose transaminase